MQGEPYLDEEFGEIRVRSDSRAVRYIFRVKDGLLQVTVPPRTTLKELRRMIDCKREALRRLILRVPDKPRLAAGSSIETRCFTINMETYRGEKILYVLKEKNLHVILPRHADTDNPAISARIKRGIMRFVAQEAPSYLKPRLDMYASRFGLKYGAFSLSSGRRILGKCDTHRNISLSVYLPFYPEELVDYVICHELAHLTVMNHGETFHALCNKYCSGRENELRNKLRRFPLPL